MYYPSEKTPPASSRNKPPSFDFDRYTPPELLAASFSSSGTDSSPEHRANLLPGGTSRPKSRGREREADNNVSIGAVILRQQLLLEQHSPPRESSSSTGMRVPSPSPQARVDSSKIVKPDQSNDMLLDIQDLEEQMKSIRAHLHGPDYLRESTKAAPSNGNKRGSERRLRSRSRLRGHRRSKSGSSEKFEYADLYQLPLVSNADSKLDMVIQTELQGDMEPAAPFDQLPAEPIANNEEASRNVLVPVEPPAEGDDHLLGIKPITLEVDTPKSSSSDLLDALPSPQQPQTSMSFSYDNAMSPSKSNASSFDGGVCTPKTVPTSSSTSFSQSTTNLEEDPGYMHARAAGTVFQRSLVNRSASPKPGSRGNARPTFLGIISTERASGHTFLPCRSDPIDSSTS